MKKKKKTWEDIIEGNTKRYHFKEHYFKEKFGEDIQIADAQGNILGFGLPPDIFLDMIQTLINRNMYEYHKFRKYAKKKIDKNGKEYLTTKEQTIKL